MSTIGIPGTGVPISLRDELNGTDPVQVTSLNLGAERLLAHGDERAPSGIDKRPVAGPVEVTPLGFAGDVVADERYHGGPDQAVYAYGVPDYDWWEAELGTRPEPGSFGENLVLEGLVSAELRIGDRLRFDEVVLQVTAPRIPCWKLGVRMNDPKFPKRFRASERPGAYFRVERVGSLRLGEPAVLEPYEGNAPTIVEVFRDYFDRTADEAELRRHLAAPIAARDRAAKEGRLRELLGG